MSFVQHQETSCWTHQFGKRTLRRQIHRSDSRTPSCFTANYLQCIWLAMRDHMHPSSDSDIGVHEKWRTKPVGPPPALQLAGRHRADPHAVNIAQGDS